MRADVALVERGLAPSRTAAQRLIESGRVTVGGSPLTRASRAVSPDADLAVAPAAEGDYVSRAAHKLAGALDSFAALAGGTNGPSVAGRTVLDAGASTGGFTQVALERGARRVVAVDVGHDQLAPQLRADERVTAIEGLNVREITRDDVALAGEALPDLLVADLSFISLTLVLAPLARVLAPGADAVVLIKPQFEVGRAGLGKGGVVVSDDARAAAAARVLHAARAAGLRTVALVPSSVAGEHGNRELVAWLRLEEDDDAESPCCPGPPGGAGCAPEECGLAAAARRAALGEGVLVSPRWADLDTDGTMIE